MKYSYSKTKHLMAIFAIAFTCTLASCSLFSGSSSTGAKSSTSTEAKQNFRNYGYHFTAKASNGQLLCFRYLNQTEVGCVTPRKYLDPATGASVEYKLTGDVVIPKTVSDGKKTYTVSALLATPEENQGKSLYLWGGLCDIKNLVIPETVKIIEKTSSKLSVLHYIGGENVQNIVVYGPTNKKFFWDNGGENNVISVTNEDQMIINRRNYYDSSHAGYLAGNLAKVFGNSRDTRETANCWKHVPQGIYSKNELSEMKNTIEIVKNYDIYAEVNSLNEYLNLANDEMWQIFMMSKCKNCGDFAVRNTLAAGGRRNLFMYFKITDNDKHFVSLNATTALGNNDTLPIPSHVIHNNIKYTVTDVYVSDGPKFTVVPETCKKLEFYSSNCMSIEPEVICYSPDVEIKQGERKPIYVLHVPRGCVEKYMGNAKIACLEIVDNYSVYEDGHSIKEYVNMSRNAVETAKAAKIKAEEEAKVAQQKKEAAEKKAYRNQLAKKYGAKYVNALFDKGQITIGMPVELFDIGLNEHLYKNPRISYIELDGQTSRGACFRMYCISTNDFSSKFVGWVWSKNGKVAAVKY